MKVPVLTTERLVMREMVDSDLDATAAICAGSEVMRRRGSLWEPIRPA